MRFDGRNYKVMAYLDTANEDAGYNTFKYLEEKDELMDYLLNKKENLSNVKHYSQRRNGNREIVKKEWVGPEIIDICLDDNWEEFEYKGERFLANNRYYKKTNKKKSSDYYIELVDRVYDDRHFKWKEDHKGVKTTAIEENTFKFVITYRPLEKRAYVEVKYIKCENRHRNIVTMTEIEVIGPTNEAIKAAIRKWKDELRKALN